ncbi:hypothetical protein GECvBGOT_gp178c [Salmonella phage GEC_vB_GOT]|nr:hypothetical protein GECvBGOT_gp178c [Salmonella phage GEC_vB_GOT]
MDGFEPPRCYGEIYSLLHSTALPHSHLVYRRVLGHARGHRPSFLS